MRSLAIACALLAPTLALVAGCHDPNACESNFVGDPSAEPEMEIVHRTADGRLVSAVAGGAVELFAPPQGGQVFLTAARIRNVDACGLRIEGAFRDDCTNRILGLDGRPFLVRETEDGWLEPMSPTSLSSWANVPACPTAAATRAVDGEPYTLTVTVTDITGRRVSRSMPVVPTCDDASERCQCECSRGYALGDRCESDAGETDAGDRDGGCP